MIIDIMSKGDVKIGTASVILEEDGEVSVDFYLMSGNELRPETKKRLESQLKMLVKPRKK